MTRCFCKPVLHTPPPSTRPPREDGPTSRWPRALPPPQNDTRLHQAETPKPTHGWETHDATHPHGARRLRWSPAVVVRPQRPPPTGRTGHRGERPYRRGWGGGTYPAHPTQHPSGGCVRSGGPKRRRKKKAGSGDPRRPPRCPAHIPIPRRHAHDGAAASFPPPLHRCRRPAAAHALEGAPRSPLRVAAGGSIWDGRAAHTTASATREAVSPGVAVNTGPTLHGPEAAEAVLA